MRKNKRPLFIHNHRGVNKSISGFRLFLIFFIISINTSGNCQNIRVINYKADTIKYDQIYGKDVTRFLWNVRISHDDIVMYCDSAHVNQEKNSFLGYGNVYLNQNDTIEAYGDLIDYDGNNKIARLRQNVKLIHEEMVLTTNYLDHDMENDVSYYFNGGEIVDTANFISSSIGRYYSKKKEFFFKDNVVLTNEENLMKSDTLEYSRNTKISYFFGPTEIFSDSNYIYCENGWYNTDSDIAQFEKDAFYRSGAQTMKGDSLFYDRNNGIGEAFNNVEITDSTENMSLLGDYAYFNEGKKISLITGNALFLQVSESDTLFLHSDTLLSMYDSSFTTRSLKAFHHVKFFRKDIQGKCDSLIYSFKDSLIQLFSDPVLWNEENQLSAETIILYTKNMEIDRVELNDIAFIIAQEDSIRFNQIKGKQLTGYVSKRELYKIDVNGNGQAVYFPIDEGEIIGTNKSESSNMVIFLTDGKISKIKLMGEPNPILYPNDDLKREELYLDGFLWLIKSRPKNKNDIFIWNE